MLDVGRITVIKRNAQEVDFDFGLIERAVDRAFHETKEPIDALQRDGLLGRIRDKVTTQAAVQDGAISVEAIQDLVETSLMEAAFTATAKAYILYRQKKHELRSRVKVDPAAAAAFLESGKYFTTPLQMFQHINKYSRFRYDLGGRREAWPESCRRVIDYFKWHMTTHYPQVTIDSSEWDELYQAMLTLEAFPSMRTVQMAGPALQRCQVGAYNCAATTIAQLRDFGEFLYVLMQGSGITFSVEYDGIEDLPKIRKQKKGATPCTHAIPDSTEGWCDALLFGLEKWYVGEDVEFDYSQIRPAGSILKTKGGRASGPDPLRELLNHVRGVVLGRQGRRLRSIDVHDICCMIARIVEGGGMRRAATLSLSDLDDDLMRNCKHGQFWHTYPYRSQANNSAVYNERPDDATFLAEWLEMVRSGKGERGIFNRAGAKAHLPPRRKKAEFLPNPCGEIALRPHEFCNLSMGIVRPTDTEADLIRKVRLAAIFGTIQSTMTNFQYISEAWKKNCEEERLLGIDLAGASDNKLLRPWPAGSSIEAQRCALLRKLRDVAIAVNKQWADRLGVAQSAAVTCNKPGGNSSVLLNIGNAITGWYAPYMRRNVRVNAVDPMARFLIDEGVPHAPEVGEADATNPRVWVFGFPMRAPEGALLKDDLPAISQLENWLAFKQCWCEHNPSVTIYVRPGEWVAVCNWVMQHWDAVGGLTFFPAETGVYPLAPFEKLTAEQYEAFVKSFPAIHWEKFPRYEMDDRTTLSGDIQCAGQACAL